MNANLGEPFILKSDATSVQLWARNRLPFEPQGDSLEARNALRRELKSMVAVPGRILAATYTSLDPGYFDVENVLLYNVGAAAFGATAIHGLRFERQRSQPGVCPKGNVYDHHHHYQLMEWPADSDRAILCQFEFELPKFTALKPHDVWWAASTATPLIQGKVTGRFEMEVVVESPRPVKNLAMVIKPLLDGLISALHSDSGVDESAIQRLALKTGWDSGNIRSRLTTPSLPLLGSRRVLYAYRDFIKWNPADELCESCTLLQRASSSPRCTVKLLKS